MTVHSSTHNLTYQRQNLPPYCMKCDASLNGVSQDVCPKCGGPFQIAKPETVNDGLPLGSWGRWALHPFGWKMHLFTALLSFIILLMPWFYSNLDLQLRVLGLLVLPFIIWLFRLLAYLGTGIALKQSWRRLFKRWKCTLVFPGMVMLMLWYINQQIPLRIEIVFHQPQLNQLASQVTAGQKITRTELGSYTFEWEDPVSNCPTLRCPETGDILVFHPGGPPPNPRFSLWHLWGDWYGGYHE